MFITHNTDIRLIADSLRQRSKEELQEWLLDQLINKGSSLLKRTYPHQFEFYIYIKTGKRRVSPHDIHVCLGAQLGLRELPTVFISLPGYSSEAREAVRKSRKEILLLELSQLMADMRINEESIPQPYTIYFYPKFIPSNLIIHFNP